MPRPGVEIGRCDVPRGGVASLGGAGFGADSASSIAAPMDSDASSSAVGLAPVAMRTSPESDTSGCEPVVVGRSNCTSVVSASLSAPSTACRNTSALA